MCFHFSETAFGNFICMKDSFAWKEEKIKKRERWADKIIWETSLENCSECHSCSQIGTMHKNSFES